MNELATQAGYAHGEIPGTSPLPIHEFHPEITITNPRQLYEIDNGNTRLYQEASLDRTTCLQGCIPHALLLIGTNGDIWRRDSIQPRLLFRNGQQTIDAGPVIRTENGYAFGRLNPDQSFDTIRGVVFIPVSPKGNLFMAELMDVDKNGNALAPHDLPPHMQRTLFGTAAGILTQLRPDGPANIGETISTGLTGRGLQSLLWLHIGAFQFDQETNDLLTKEWILAAREKQTTWDGGLNNEVNEFAADTFKQKILPRYWPHAEVHESPMGPAVYLPGFSPGHLIEQRNGGLRFVSEFLQRYCMEIMLAKTRETFRRHFRHEFTEVVDFVQAAHSQPVDWQRYEALLSLRDDPVITRPEDIIRHELYLQDRKKPLPERVMRYPLYGHAWSLRQYDDGALFLATPSLFNADCGPIELHGIGLNRPPGTQYMPEEKAAKHRDVIFAAAGK